MKAADLKTGVLYNLSAYTVPGYVIDPNRHYSKEAYRSAWSRGVSKLHQPNNSGKGTHVLTLAKRGSYMYDKPVASAKEAAKYTLSQYRKGVTPPFGWMVELTTPNAMKGTWEEHEARIARDEDLRKIAQAKYTEKVNEIETLIADLKAAGVEGAISRHTVDAITLYVPQVRQIIELLSQK